MKKPIKPLEELLDSVRDIEGFPIGKDEDILGLSDPPYYTACPNPYINEFIEENGTPYDEKIDEYHREPYSKDVKANKNDKLSRAHAYHTKVPYKAIEKYIRHYTNPGDVILDCFAGSGMTGVAAQRLKRKCILSELSPVACYISANYSSSADVIDFLEVANKLIKDMIQELSWLYETQHELANGIIESIIYSEAFYCPYCKKEYVLWDYAVDTTEKLMNKEFKCKNCNAIITKSSSEKKYERFYDKSLKQEIEQSKTVPVEIVYKYKNKIFRKKPDENDIKKIKKIDSLNIPFWHPIDKLPNGHNLNQPIRSHGYTHAHHFFTRRNLYCLAYLRDRIVKIDNDAIKNKLLLTLNSLILRSSRKAILAIGYYFHGGGGYITTISGNLYIPSLNVEVSVIEQFKNRVKKINAINEECFKNENVIVSTQSATDMQNIKNESIDYVFIDPPFGENLMYSEINFINESWIKIFTRNNEEAIINRFQSKDLQEYNELILKSFKEIYRLLKPSRWITLEFNNSRTSVWNAIQDCLSKAGFIIAQTGVLDKTTGSFIIHVSPNAVKNDLIINAYKPQKSFVQKFLKNAGEGLEEEFVKMHLSHLKPEPSVERTEQMLYSKLLAYYR